FHRGNVHLAVALPGVSVANLEKRARSMDRKIESGSRNQLFVVHVAGMNTGRGAIDTPVGLRRSHSHAAEKRMQRNLNSRSKLGDHAITIQGNDFYARIGKVIGQKAG